MESGVHGPAGLHVVKHVVTVSGRENDSAIIPNPPTMAHPVRVLHIRRRNAELPTAARVCDLLLHFCNSVLTYDTLFIIMKFKNKYDHRLLVQKQSN